MHLAFPVRFARRPDGTTTFATVQQDTGEHTSGRVELLLRTPQGWVNSNPRLGMSDPTFRLAANPERIERMLNEFDPDAVATVREDPGLLDDTIRRLTVEVPDGD